MYSTSSQLKNWVFEDSKEIEASREDANERFLAENAPEDDDDDDDDEEAKARRKQAVEEKYLTVKEERQLVQHYEYVLKDFCGKFSPSMPKYVVGTTLAYMKRFYMENSVMDYHPRDVMLTALYLACKVEEFNVSIAQFVGNLKGDRNKAAELVLSYELMVMEKLHFHLTVHNPYRPLEGFFIDLKARYRAQLTQAEVLRRGADAFVDRSLNSDVMLLFPPTHIALAALAQAAGECKVELEPYFLLLMENCEEKLAKLKASISKIQKLVRKLPTMNRENIKKIEMKLEKCRNQAKNPASEDWKKKIQEAEEEETARTFKRRKTAESKKDPAQSVGFAASEGFKPLN